MPRSNLNWASRARAMYIDDQLAGPGFINRQMLVDYFGIEKSLGSMDITAYGLRTPIRKASAGELIANAPLQGYKLGGKAWYVPAVEWASVTGSTAERRAAWGLLPSGVDGGARGWFAEVVGCYIADYERDAMPVDYFGISAREAFAYPVQEASTERAKVWEYFR